VKAPGVAVLLCLVAAACTALAVARRAPRSAAPRLTPAASNELAAVRERIGSSVPVALPFVDARGRPVRLVEAFHRDRPVLLLMGYAACPNLCSLVLHGTTSALSSLTDLKSGRDYQLLYVSLDPREPAPLAVRKQAALLSLLGQPLSDRESATYLRGTETSVRSLAEAVGFGYSWDERARQYAHPAVAIVLTPEARIAAYVHGVAPEPRALEVPLRRAARGELEAGGLVGLALRCFRFDAGARRYAPEIQTYLRTGGLLVFVLLASSIAWLARAHRRRS
jgi:protein SCO1/2